MEDSDSADPAAYLGFRRRCSWCGVVLRGWQLNLCRMCKLAAGQEWGTAPCVHAERWDQAPDEWYWTRARIRDRVGLYKEIMKGPTKQPNRRFDG